MKRYIIGIAVLFGIIVVLSLTQVMVSNSFSTDGITLGQMQDTITKLEKENMLLKEKLYTRTSYTTIASEAASLGFVESNSHLVLGTPQPLAIRQ